MNAETVWNSPKSAANANAIVDPSTQAGADIGALAFTVLMEASKSAADDLKQIMQEVESANKGKAVSSLADADKIPRT